MYKYTFYGKVFPIESDVNANDIGINEQLNYKGKPTLFDVKIKIAQSKIMVSCRTDMDDFHTLRNSIKGYLQEILNNLSFTKNCYMQILLEEVVNEDSKEKFTGLSLNTENILPTKREHELSIGEMFKANTPQISTALNNFRLARENPQDTAFFCFRAIEAVKNDFKGKDDKENWEMMRNALNLTKDYINKFKVKHADPQRHGHFASEIYWEDREITFKIAWTIINRYLNYCKNNNQKLDEKDFPIL